LMFCKYYAAFLGVQVFVVAFHSNILCPQGARCRTSILSLRCPCGLVEETRTRSGNEGLFKIPHFDHLGLSNKYTVRFGDDQKRAYGRKETATAIVNAHNETCTFSLTGRLIKQQI
jgi:hypothetical protein